MPKRTAKREGSPDDECFMRLALKLAKEAGEAGEVPVGSVVVQEGQVVGRGRNRIQERNSGLAHAEILAIEEASAKLGRRLSGCTLYSTIEPCPMCAGAIILSRVDRVVFGANDPKFGAVGSVVNILESDGFNHRPQVVSGVLQEECAGLIQKFFQELRREGEKD